MKLLSIPWFLHVQFEIGHLAVLHFAPTDKLRNLCRTNHKMALQVMDVYYTTAELKRQAPSVYTCFAISHGEE